MKTLKITFALIAVVLLSSCNFNINIGEDGNGNVVTEDRHINEDFNQVRGSSGLDVYLTQGNENQVQVEADDNLLQFIETYVEDGKLIVSTSDNIGRATAKKVHITFKSLNVVEASSGADVIGNSVIKSESLALKSSSGAELELEVVAKDLMAKTSSGSEMKLSGKAASLIADASSGSELNAKGVLVLNCNAEASSGAEITVNVSQKLEVNASSGGEVNYYGNPAAVNKNKSRSGSVQKM